MALEDYIPPGVQGNEEYILPPMEILFKDFRKAGVDLDVFLSRYIEVYEERASVVTRLAEILQSDPEAMETYRDLLRLALLSREQGLTEARMRAERVGEPRDKKKFQALLDDYARIKFQLPTTLLV